MSPRLKILSFVMLTLAMIGGFSWYWLLHTESGARFAWSVAQPYAPGELELQNFSGDLSSGVRLDRLHFKNNKVDLAVERLAVSIDVGVIPISLTIKSLDIDTINLQLEEPPTARDAEQFSLGGVLNAMRSPVRLFVSESNIAGINVRRPGEPTLQIASSVSFSGALHDTLVIDNLLLRSSFADVTATGQLDLRAPFAAQVRADALLRDVGIIELDGMSLSAMADGDVDRLITEISSSSPELSMTASVVDVLGKSQLDIRSRIARVTWPFRSDDPKYIATAVDVRANGTIEQYDFSMDGDIELPKIGAVKVEANGEGRLQSLSLSKLVILGDGVETAITGELVWSNDVAFAGSILLDKLDPFGLIPTWPQDFPLSGQATGQWTGQKISLSDFRLAIAGTDSALSAAGDIDIADRTVRGKLDWRRVRWPLDSAATVVSRSGDLNISGNLSAWNADGLVTLQTYNYPEGVLTLEGSGDMDAAKVTILDSDVLQGNVSGEASYSWRGTRSFELGLQLDHVQSNSLYPEWPGVLSGFVKIAGTQQPFAVEVNLESLDGSIGGQGFVAEGGMTFGLGAVNFSSFSVTHGASHVALHGDLYDAKGVGYSLQLQDFGAYEKSATGTVQASGRVSLHAARPKFRSALIAENISAGNFTMSSLSIEDNSAGSSESIDMKVSASGLRAYGNDIDKLTVIATGDAEQHDISIEMKAEHVAAALHGSGVLDGWRGAEALTWRGLLNELQFELAGGDTFELDSAATFAVSGTSVSLERRCLTSDSQASICLGGEWAREQNLDASAQLQDFPVSALLLPTDLELDFSQELSGQFAVSSTGNVATRIDADIDISAGRVVSAYDPDLFMDTGEGRFGFRVTQDRLETGELDIPLPGYGAIDIDFGISEVALGFDSTLSGSVVVDVNDISILARMVPFLDGDSGRLTSDIVIGGTPSRPLANGRFSLHDAEFYYQPLGTKLSNVQVDARILDDNQLELQGSFRAGDGSGAITTSAAYETGQTPALEFSIAGSDLLLVDIAELRVKIEPDVRISVSGNELQIGGSIKVPHARVTPDKIPVRTESESEDVVIVAGRLPGNDQAASTNTRIKVRGGLQVLLGNDVTIDLDVAKARLGGTVDFQWHDELIPIANGNYKIDGAIAVLGQVLTISDGNIRFPDVPANSPYLNISAERDIYGNTQVKTAGILVTGTARNPVVEAYTYPLTTEERALTLLVTGSDFDYEQGVGALDFGTYVSPRLFLSYGVGLFERENIFSARFDLKKGFGIRATSGRRDSGVDINYRLDK